MDLTKNTQLKSIAEELQKEFQQQAFPFDIVTKSFSQIKEISEWKYSTGDYYHQEPFFHELNQLTQAKLLKKQYPSYQEAKLKGAYSHGFSQSDLILTIIPTKLETVVPVKYFWKDLEVLRWININHIQTIDGKLEKSKAQGYGKAFWINPTEQIFITTGASREYYILHYLYENDHPVQVRKYASIWTHQEIFTLNYEDGKLVEITSPSRNPTEETITWKSK